MSVVVGQVLLWTTFSYETLRFLRCLSCFRSSSWHYCDNALAHVARYLVVIHKRTSFAILMTRVHFKSFWRSKTLFEDSGYIWSIIFDTKMSIYELDIQILQILLYSLYFIWSKNKFNIWSSTLLRPKSNFQEGYYQICKYCILKLAKLVLFAVAQISHFLLRKGQVS